MRRIMVVLLVVVAASVSAQWDAFESEDLMAGTTSVVIANIAGAQQGALRDPVIYIRAGYEVFIHWGGYSVDRGTIIIMTRFDDKPPQPLPVTLSTTREATFVDARIILDQLKEATTFVASVNTSTGRQMIAAWDVSGLVDAIEQVR
jgi:hypothetical protein